ncbi:hypothetical protein [Streptomyces kebangsaanensis]|uniref:hypothetical protein n=1 Tax=Streptomyces kebangsaanensis TaxID=864058 RepID=UPI0018FE58C3|nr:hypothetical protein [Streptomyces kebangsaanensis]
MALRVAVATGQPHQPDLDQLTALFKTRLKRMQCPSDLLGGLVTKTGFDPKLS